MRYIDSQYQFSLSGQNLFCSDYYISKNVHNSSFSTSIQELHPIFLWYYWIHRGRFHCSKSEPDSGSEKHSILLSSQTNGKMLSSNNSQSFVFFQHILVSIPVENNIKDELKTDYALASPPNGCDSKQSKSTKKS